MGYQVWADLEDLRGGNKHWRVIEETLQDQTAKVLVVTSRAGRRAEGVEQEINIAKGVERELGLETFIIQLRVDDLPYTQLFPTLNNRIAISFTENWGLGFRKLVQQLDEESIPKPNTDRVAFEFSSQVLEAKSDRLLDSPEPAFASWLPITLPEEMYLYEFPSSAKTICSSLLDESIPSNIFGSFLLTFAVPDTIAYYVDSEPSRLRYKQYRTSDWTNCEELEKCQIRRGDRRHTLNGLLNSAWEKFLESRELSAYFLSNEKAYFFPSPEKTPVKQPYSDPLGRSTRPITLVGESSRYSSLWHAAISARATQSPYLHFACRLHVAFTEDGFIPIADGDKAFKMRRTFCKMWWNDRWRRIYFAFLERLFDGKGELLLSTGGKQNIVIGKPIEFTCPYTLETDRAIQSVEAIEDALPPVEDDNHGVFLEGAEDE